jgi:hypothetical protein
MVQTAIVFIHEVFIVTSLVSGYKRLRLMKRLFLHSLLAMILLGATTASPQSFVAGEVMLRFTAGSLGSFAVEKALQDNPPDLRSLEPAVAAMQAGTRLPLKPDRLASGNWVLLKIDSGRLAEQAADGIRMHRNVASIRLVPTQPVQAGAPPSLLIEFKPSSHESQILANPERKKDALLQLVSELASTAECPLKSSVQENRLLLVEIDLPALTLLAVERLKTLRDIENVQPNYLVGLRPPP